MPEGGTTLTQPSATQHGFFGFSRRESRLEIKETLFWVALARMLLSDSPGNGHILVKRKQWPWGAFHVLNLYRASRMTNIFHFHIQSLRISKPRRVAQRESFHFYRKKDVFVQRPMPSCVSWGVWPCAIFVLVRMGLAPRTEKRTPTGNPSQRKLGNRRRASAGDKHIERKLENVWPGITLGRRSHMARQ